MEWQIAAEFRRGTCVLDHEGNALRLAGLFFSPPKATFVVSAGLDPGAERGMQGKQPLIRTFIYY